MADYKGSIKLMAERLYKNNTLGQVISDPDYNRITCSLYIPNISSIDLSVFDEVRYPYINGVQQLDKPFYIWQGREHTDKIAFPLLKGLTWIIPDDMNGMLGVSNVHPSDNSGYFTSPIEGDLYGNTYPHTGSGTSSSRYQYVWGLDGVGGAHSMKGKYLYGKVFNTDLLPFQGLQSDISTVSDGYVVAPGSVKTFLNMSNYLFMGFNSNNYPAYVTQLGSSYRWNGTNYTSTLGGRYDVVKITNKDFITEQVKIPSMRNINGKYYANDFYQMIYAFLIDDNEQLWIMSVADASNTDYDNWYNTTVTLTKASNVYKSYTGTDFFAETANVQFVDEGQFGFVNDYFLDLLSVKSAAGGGYNDGGPDAVGPGDPYGDLDNVNGIVGGQDINTDKDIGNIDTTPNTDYDRFAVENGFFGSYVLEANDLVKYTRTLKYLYKHSSDILFGEICQAQADRLESNVTSLIMLPLEIPDSDYTSTLFALGNVGVMGTNGGALGEHGYWIEYKAGNNYTNANYLTKFTKIHNVPLGLIKHNYDNFLDFAPYSTASLYIPYIGKVELPINLIQSTDDDPRPLTLQFRINYTTGDFVAILNCNINGNDVPISHWNGNCARPVKVAVNDDSAAIRAAAGRIASMFAGSAGIVNTQSLNPVKQKINEPYRKYNKSSAEPSSFSVSTPTPPTSVTTSQHMLGNGSLDGELGYLGIQQIMLTVERPVWWKPFDYGGLIGYPTKKIAKLSSLEGFAVISDIHIRCSATGAEKEEITRLLAEGVDF